MQVVIIEFGTDAIVLARNMSFNNNDNNKNDNWNCEMPYDQMPNDQLHKLEQINIE